jgi:hypothetical protein
MERDKAIEYLRNECVFDPPLTEHQAEALWVRYHDEVVALGSRDCASPPRQPLDAAEQAAANTFVSFFRGLPGGAPNMREWIKIDPRQLVVHQLCVVLDRSRGYQRSISTPAGWRRMCLDPSIPPPRPIRLHGCLGGIEYEIPHMEFMAIFSQEQIVTPTGPVMGMCISPQESAKYVTVCEFQGRTILWAGYHRSFARMVMTADDAIARSLPMVLTTDADFLISPASPNQGLRDMITGPTPPLFGDFLDERFFIAVNLRKRKYLLRVTSQVVPVDDGTP